MKIQARDEALQEGARMAAMFAIGAAAGTFAMWLLSPRTGFENRMRMRQVMRSGRDRVAQVPQTLATASNTARSRLNRSIDQAQDRPR